jgi:DNA-binding ferritin-like protein
MDHARQQAGGSGMTPRPSDIAEQRGKLIKLLQNALELAEDLGDRRTAHLIERALDEARSQQFKPKP